MADCGFLIKLNGKGIVRCFSCRFDYDEWQYVVNEKDTKPLPDKLNKIEITVEE